MVGPALAEIAGITDVYLFGSWAARYAGEPGHEPADVDILVVGRPSRLALARAERTLSERLGREVNIVDVSPEEWDASESGFLREVRHRPLVPVSLNGGRE